MESKQNNIDSQSPNDTAEQVGEVCLISHSPYWIFKVAAKGNLKELKRILNDNDKSSLACDQKGLTPLHYAARGNHAEMVKYILGHGPDINARDNEGNTPLHLAVASSATDCISLLVISGADLTLANNRLLAPINYSIVCDATQSLKTLISYETVDRELAGENGYTPVHYAAKYDRAECMRILLNAGVPMCTRCNNGSYPIHTAAYHASAKTIEVMISDCTGRYGVTREYVLSLKDGDNHTPLHAAVNSADLEAMRVCLRAGALVDAQQEDRSTPVHYACSQGNAPMVEVMFQLQADRMRTAIKIKDAMGMTPLHRAAIFDHVEVVSLLIDNGADVDSQDSQQRSPILVAASKGSWKTVFLLIDSGADASIKDNNNRNFIHIAIQSGISLQDIESNTIAKFFYRSGKKNVDIMSQLNESDINGCTPLHYASKQGFLRVIDDLIKFGASVNAKNNANESPFHFAARYGRYNTCRRLLDSKIGAHVVNEKDGLGRTALHIAAGEGHTKIVTLLLQRGGSTVRCFQGNSALHLAARNGYTQCMRCILAVHNNLVNSANKDGDTPLHQAAKAGQTRAVTLLLSNGANMPTNNEGRTFFDYIIANRHEEVAKAVIQHDRWQEVMDSISIYGVPMYGLIENLPTICQVTYNFRYLQGYCWKERAQKKELTDEYLPMKTMRTMVKFGRVDCLSHPVCTNYIGMKWNAYGVWIHMTNLAVYATFLAMLTWFVVEYRLPDLSSINITDVTARKELIHKHFSCSNPLSAVAKIILYLLAVYVLINMGKEFIQMYQQRERYLLDHENFLEWMLYITTAAFVVPFLTNSCGMFQWQAATLAVFLAWFNLLLLLQRFDLFGIYIVMFLEILRTLVHVVAVFSILIIAFGLAFFILLGDDHVRKAHIYPGLSMIRSTMMMLELDYMASFNEPYNEGNLMDFPFPGLTLALLLLFVLLMPILLMNLLIGLAVGDIESVQRDARLKRLAMQVDMHTDLERKLPSRFLVKVEKSQYTLHPNRCGRTFLQVLSLVTSRMADESDQTDSVHSRLQHELREDLFKQKQKLKEMSALMDKQLDLLRLVVQKMEIQSEGDYLDEGVNSDDILALDRIKMPSLWASPIVQTDVVTGTKVLTRWKRSMKSRSDDDSTCEVFEAEQNTAV